jgi:hypothetical protein
VLLEFLWPEPGALVAADDVLAALLQHAPWTRREWRPESPAQYAFVLGRDRTGPANPADLATRFDNRYELGVVDLPTAERLRAGDVAAVVACRHAATPPAPDLTDYLDTLEAAGVPVRRLALD